jgi:hypothetical protein
LDVPADGEWGRSVVIDWYNLHIPQIYYFVVMDCDRNLHAKENKLPKLLVEIEMTNQLTSS